MSQIVLRTKEAVTYLMALLATLAQAHDLTFTSYTDAAKLSDLYRPELRGTWLETDDTVQRFAGEFKTGQYKLSDPYTVRIDFDLWLTFRDEYLAPLFQVSPAALESSEPLADAVGRFVQSGGVEGVVYPGGFCMELDAALSQGLQRDVALGWPGQYRRIYQRLRTLVAHAGESGAVVVE